jgi:hypothetical protein
MTIHTAIKASGYIQNRISGIRMRVLCADAGSGGWGNDQVIKVDRLDINQEGSTEGIGVFCTTFDFS